MLQLKLADSSGNCSRENIWVEILYSVHGAFMFGRDMGVGDY